MFTKKSTHPYRDISWNFLYLTLSRVIFHEEESDNVKEIKAAHGGKIPDMIDKGDVVAKVDAPADKPEEDSRKAAADEREKKADDTKDEAVKDREALREDISRPALDKIAKAIEKSPEEIRDAMYNYDLTEHDEPNRKTSPGKAIIDAIIKAKSEGKLEGVRFVYLGGTNGVRHDLSKLERRATPDQKAWHKKKSEAFKQILDGKGRFKPPTIKTLIDTNEKLIVAYRGAVAADNPTALKTFLTDNESTFCDAAGLFDLALAYQRADDLYQAINGGEKGEKIDPLKNVITLDLAGDVDEVNCKSKLLFEGVEEAEEKEEVPPPGGRGVVAPIPGGRGEVKPTPPRGPNDLPPEPPVDPTPDKRGVVVPHEPPRGDVILTPEKPEPPPGKESQPPAPRGPNDLPPEPAPAPEPPPSGAVIEGKLTPADSVQAELRVSTFPANIDVNNWPGKGNINEEKLQEAKKKLQALDPETKRRLHFLTPPIFGNEDYGMPQRFRKGNAEGIPEGYYVKIDVNKTPEEITKALKKAAEQILEPANINDMTDTERAAEERAKKAGLPFKNIRQAYLDDTKGTPRIDWSDKEAKLIPPYEWVEPSQDEHHWVNCATESPAEKAARIAKGEVVKSADAEEVKKAQERDRLKREEEEKKGLAEETAAEEAEKKRIAEEPATQEKKDKLNAAVAALEAKMKECKVKCGDKQYSLDLHAHDNFKDEELRNITIDGEIARIKKLTENLDKIGTIFDDMSDDTKNILRSVRLMIDQDKSGKPADPDISGKNGDYMLWFNILHPDEQLKKEILNRKNAYVKGGKQYKQDTPLEAIDRAAAGTTPFKNSREAYTEKGIALGKDDSGKEIWNVAKDHAWAGSGPYNYATKEVAAPAEEAHEVNSKDDIVLDDDNNITTSEIVNGVKKTKTYKIISKLREGIGAENITMHDDETNGDYLVMQIFTDKGYIANLWLGYGDGSLKISSLEEKYAAKMKGDRITITKKK